MLMRWLSGWTAGSSHAAALRRSRGRPAVRRRVSAERIRIAFHSSPGILTSGVIAVMLVLFAMTYTGPGLRAQPALPDLLWAAATLAALMNSVYIRWRFNRRARSDDEAHREVRRLVANTMVMAAAWGSSAWILLPAPSNEQDGFLLVAIAMVLMGGAGSQAVHRPLVLGFTLTLTLVFATGLLRSGDALHVLLGLGFFLYCAVVLMYARNQEIAVTTAIELSMHNDELLAQRTQQQRAAEEAQRQAERLREQSERADRSKTAFIAAASHDLRQPMHALVQYVAHLKRSCSDRSAGPTIDKIESSVASMEDLLNAVLDFSKIALGEVKPQIEALELAPLVDRIDTQVRPLALAKGLHFVVQPRAGWVCSDSVLLERVLRNIAQNAVRYTDAGTIVMRARERGGITRVLVADSGIGIPDHEKTRIFEEYYQVDNPARDRRRGLGLGLAIVRDLAGLLGARVRVKSRLGQGSTFAIDLPATAAAPARVAAASATAGGGTIDYVRGAFAVLIDDDPLARDGLATTLLDFGCRVLVAGSGVEALHALADAEFAPQIIVSDYRLEGGATGLEAIAMVADNQRALFGPGFELPAILISGDTSPEELERVRGAGYPMLHKPVGAERLYAAMNALLGAAAQT